VLPPQAPLGEMVKVVGDGVEIAVLVVVTGDGQWFASIVLPLEQALSIFFIQDEYGDVQIVLFAS
jgi:hypothetical protein